MTDSTFCLLLGLVLLTGCPDRETRPGKDDTSAPADGDTGGLACEPELERVKAELHACQNPPGGEAK